LLLAVAAAALVGCDWHHSTTITSHRGDGGAAARKPRIHRVLVTVVDGDTHRRVAHARVRIGNRTAISNRYGINARVQEVRKLSQNSLHRGDPLGTRCRWRCCAAQ